MAARAFVEWCQDLPEDAVEQLDSELVVAGAPTLTTIRRGGDRHLLAVLRRGRIRTEREWHVVNGIFADRADQTLSISERELASNLLREYEALRTRKLPQR